jgi:hypothetical protein
MPEQQETPQERHARLLRMAREAENAAARSSDLNEKRRWLEFARSWLALAEENPPNEP